MGRDTVDVPAIGPAGFLAVIIGPVRQQQRFPFNGELPFDQLFQQGGDASGLGALFRIHAAGDDPVQLMPPIAAIRARVIHFIGPWTEQWLQQRQAIA